MNYAIQFHPAAEAEMNEAAAFYEDASSGLGEDFLAELERTLNQIRANPKAAPIIMGKVQRRVLRKYPYSIIHTVRGEQIRILAIMHHRRRPFYWRKRN